jgi:hypothetical protein
VFSGMTLEHQSSAHRPKPFSVLDMGAGQPSGSRSSSIFALD